MFQRDSQTQSQRCNRKNSDGNSSVVCSHHLLQASTDDLIRSLSVWLTSLWLARSLRCSVQPAAKLGGIMLQTPACHLREKTEKVEFLCTIACVFVWVCKHACTVMIGYYAISRLPVLLLYASLVFSWTCLEGKKVAGFAEKATLHRKVSLQEWCVNLLVARYFFHVHWY